MTKFEAVDVKFDAAAEAADHKIEGVEVTSWFDSLA